MTSTRNLIKLSFLLPFMINCYSVSIDYFTDNDESDAGQHDVNNTISDNIDQRKTTISEDNDIQKAVKNCNRSRYDQFSASSVCEDRNVEVYLEKEELSANHSTSLREGPPRSTNNALLIKATNLSQTNSATLDIDHDYEYAYDTNYEYTTLHQRLLRQKTTESTTVTTESNSNTTDASNLKYIVDFYNLQPAAGTYNPEDTVGVSNYVNKTVWYVPERYPCWELPMLYGELGFKKRTTDVFLLHLGTLKNVINTKDHITPKSEPYIIPVAQTLNKWCAASPCYGDHTLCLFSEKTNSKLCVNKYKVSTPSTVEQIALVNTVNSMRNRVANGKTDIYRHLPTASNMKQIIYDFDLEKMAKAWLRQCLPGPAACSAHEGNYVSQLECTKYAEHCCVKSFKTDKASKCIPRYECFVAPIIGCIHAWFWSAGSQLTTTDVQCGHMTSSTYTTVQLIWADTNKIGCAYGVHPNGDVRVVCNFAPGAPFYLETKYYCGFIAHKEIHSKVDLQENITDLKYLSTLGINMSPVKSSNYTDAEFPNRHVNYSLRSSDIDILSKIYKRGWARQKLGDYSNGTIAFLARLVTRFTFNGDSGAKCDTNEPIYEIGKPGSLCLEKGRRFHALCYDFGDPTPGYRLVAIVAPVALFSLILYDLFSGVVRQTNY